MTTSSFIDSMPLLGDGAALRERADKEGYLFFKRLLPAAEVLRVRADILGVVEGYGWRRAGEDLLSGAVDVEALDQVPEDEMRLDIGVSVEAYHDVQKLESVHRLPHHPRLVSLYETLFERQVLVHPRHIVRLISPHRAMVPTPVHQDSPLIQGTSNTWTCWFPLGDCPPDIGGLTVLRASHHLGALPIQLAEGAGEIAAQLCPGEDEWVQGGYQAGDVLTFPGVTVHKGLPCQRKGEMRLSFDVRYQPVNEPVDASSLRPHCPLTWDEIYADWESDDLQRYWEQQPLSLAPWDGSFLQPSRRIC